MVAGKENKSEYITVTVGKQKCSKDSQLPKPKMLKGHDGSLLNNHISTNMNILSYQITPYKLVLTLE